MLDTTQINDPEYRWQHKQEMLEIMKCSSSRSQLGIIPIKYNELRYENDKLIQEITSHKLNWRKLEELTYMIPDNLNKKQKRKNLQPIDRLHFEKRDMGLCYLCGSTYHYGSCNQYSMAERSNKLSQLHHRTPNGDLSENNMVTLCIPCHQLVHLMLYSMGKWRYERPV
jgi:5-methylcytosine-specific restriction endonuclease McrA